LIVCQFFGLGDTHKDGAQVKARCSWGSHFGSHEHTLPP
jgi:hypothetical protein